MSIKKLRFFCVLVFVVMGSAATGVAQQNTSISRPAPPPKPASGQQGGPSTGKLSETKPPAAQYDIGHIVKSLAALEGQVADLKKKNAELEGKTAQLNKQLEQLSANLLSQKLAQEKANTRLNRLDNALHNHTHSLPNLSFTALSAIPGMQSIANSAGVGSVVQSWNTIKVYQQVGPISAAIIP
jgi:peptidoglycan hydrolase CwlO-like protein